MGVVELPGKPNLPEEPVGRDADQQLRVQDLEGDLAPVRATGQVDARVAAFADLALDLVLTLEGAADQRQHVPRNGLVPVKDVPMVAPVAPPRKH